MGHALSLLLKIDSVHCGQRDLKVSSVRHPMSRNLHSARLSLENCDQGLFPEGEDTCVGDQVKLKASAPVLWYEVSADTGACQ